LISRSRKLSGTDINGPAVEVVDVDSGSGVNGG